jgi:hypothetical protein
VDQIPKPPATVKLENGDTPEGHPLSIGLNLGASVGEALTLEANRLGVSIEELAGFSVLYYLADLDSGRIARSIPPPAGRAPGGGCDVRDSQ